MPLETWLPEKFILVAEKCVIVFGSLSNIRSSRYFAVKYVAHDVIYNFVAIEEAHHDITAKAKFYIL